MTSRIVICQNDYPAFVMPEGTPNEGMYELCKKLEKEDLANISHRERYPGLHSVAVYYHWYEIEEYKPQ